MGPKTVPRRKRLYRSKGRRYIKKESSANITALERDSNVVECMSESSNFHSLNDDESIETSAEVGNGSEVVSICDHDYSQSPSAPCNQNDDDVVNSPIKSVSSEEISKLLQDVKHKIDFFLPYRWISILESEVIHVMCVSPENKKTVQRTLEFFHDGGIKLYVHCKPIPIDEFLHGVGPFTPLDHDSVNAFVDKMATVVNNVEVKQVCSGLDLLQYESAWAACPYGEVDRNPYREWRYVETFRSLGCSMLINRNKWRCKECSKLIMPLKRRAKAAAEEKRHINTRNTYLNEEQRLKKLEEQRREIDKAKKKLARVHTRMQEIIKKQSVVVDEPMSNALSEILNNSKVGPAQSVFLQQQIKASQLKNASGMRWHPTMIRLALSIHVTSPAAYDLIRKTGMVKLPSGRTLYDYSHAKPMEEGIDKIVLEKLAFHVETLSNKINESTGKTEKHKRYHVLMGDEMHISQNLVFQKSSGKLIGFTSLDRIDSEVKNLNQLLENCDKECEETIATKIMVYMVKGVSNGVKDVIATFGVGNMSMPQMKVWTWQVIGALERSGIAVIAFVCDGSSINRAFIRSHIPATHNPSGITFDTWNKCARERKLFFIADVPHLLKTIRNCFLNSRWDRRKSRRRMMKNRQRISWDFIIKLYEAKRGKTLRKAYKLSPMNVYPDSYARMKVKYAGQVLSKTVSLDLNSQGWPEVKETSKFILKVNDWFDCLNGAHTSIAKKTRNENVAPYTSVSDSRFELLDNFLDYLQEWEDEAKNPNITIDQNVSIASEAQALQDLEESVIDEGGLPEEEETHASRRILSKQTLDGIRMTTFAFKPMVTFLLQEGVSFINARIFTQDPLEQHFSKLRAGQGGSNHPNLGQSLKRTRAIDIIGEMGMKRAKGNSGECSSTVQVTTEKLPKRQSVRTPKFLK